MGVGASSGVLRVVLPLLAGPSAYVLRASSWPRITRYDDPLALDHDKRCDPLAQVRTQTCAVCDTSLLRIFDDGSRRLRGRPGRTTSSHETQSRARTPAVVR